VHLDRWWNPAVEDQATGRAHRIGQLRTVFVHTMLARGTLEERIDEILAEKRRLSATIVGGEAGYIASLPDSELLQTLQLQEDMT
jgi:SNF2 family DNA or RNA helicase